MKKRIILLGGTFDPVHIGHIELAENALRETGADEVHLLPSPFPPHKRGVAASGQHRLEMCRLAARSFPGIAVNDAEFRIRSAYTADTLSYLHRQEPDTQWLLLLGEDAALSLPYWKDSDLLLRLAPIVISRRKGCPRGEDLADAVALLRQKGAVIQVLTSAPPEISASQIRQMSDRQRAAFVPEQVQAYMIKNGLYRKGRSSDG